MSIDNARTPTPNEPETHESEEDVLSDPARDDRVGSDWADEGGAVPTGPATDAPAPDADEDPQRTARTDDERDLAE